MSICEHELWPSMTDVCELRNSDRYMMLDDQAMACSVENLYLQDGSNGWLVIMNHDMIQTLQKDVQINRLLTTIRSGTLIEKGY